MVYTVFIYVYFLFAYKKSRKRNYLPYIFHSWIRFVDFLPLGLEEFFSCNIRNSLQWRGQWVCPCHLVEVIFRMEIGNKGEMSGIISEQFVYWIRHGDKMIGKRSSWVRLLAGGKNEAVAGWCDESLCR